MTRLLNPILRGLTVILPLAATFSIVAWCFVLVDGLIKPFLAKAIWIPGLGVLVLISVALLVGLAAIWWRTKLMVERLEGALQLVPLLKLVYGPIKDFVDAFLGEHKCFDKPVLVTLGGGLDAEVIGFVTKDDLHALGLNDKVAVYFPQSYNFGGNLLILPRERLTMIDADSAALMAFVVSGGVASFDACANSLQATRSARRRALRHAAAVARFSSELRPKGTG